MRLSQEAAHGRPSSIFSLTDCGEWQSLSPKLWGSAAKLSGILERAVLSSPTLHVT